MEQGEVVKKDTGAMRTYQALMYGLSFGDPDQRATLRKLLLRYWEFDTAASVTIWRHRIGGAISR